MSLLFFGIYHIPLPYRRPVSALIVTHINRRFKLNNINHPHRTPLFSVFQAVIICLLLITAVFLGVLLRPRKSSAISPASFSDAEASSFESHDRGGTYIPSEDDYQPSDNADDMAHYLNDSILTASLQSGSTLSVGAITSDTSGLIINPVYDCIDDEKVLGQDITQFAFYISVVGIELSCSSETYGFASDPINYIETSLYIVNRTYDTLCPASYRSDADYGIKVSVPAFHKHDLTLSIRIVRIPDGTLMGIANLNIAYEPYNNSYRLKNLECLNDHSPAELGDEARDKMIREAAAFIEAGTERQSFIFALSNSSNSTVSAIIEKTSQTYFPVLYNDASEIVSRGSFYHCDIYAVNINRIGCGFITVYFAPQMQLWGLTGPNNPNTGDLDLKIFGYDPLFPFSKNEIAVLVENKEAFGL